MTAFYPSPGILARTVPATSPPGSAVDHYAALGVADTAPHLAIRQAYRSLMRTVHPDVAGDDPTAAARALAAITAWGVLRDPVARAAYDRRRAAAASAAAPEVSWGRDGVRPVTIEQLRDAAARESAYSEIGRQQRAAYSRASWRLGASLMAVGSALLAVVVLL